MRPGHLDCPSRFGSNTPEAARGSVSGTGESRADGAAPAVDGATGRDRTSRDVDARGRGETGAREQPRHRRPTNRPADLRRRHRQHPIGLQPDALVDRQQFELEERVDEHDFRRTDRRDDQQLDVPLQRRADAGRAVGRRRFQPAARQPAFGDVQHDRDDQPAVQPDVVGGLQPAAAPRFQDRYDAPAIARHPHQSGHLGHPAAAGHDQHDCQRPQCVLGLRVRGAVGRNVEAGARARRRAVPQQPGKS